MAAARFSLSLGFSWAGTTQSRENSSVSKQGGIVFVLSDTLITLNGPSATEDNLRFSYSVVAWSYIFKKT